jgi:hypothetical protein
MKRQKDHWGNPLNHLGKGGIIIWNNKLQSEKNPSGDGNLV